MRPIRLALVLGALAFSACDPAAVQHVTTAPAVLGTTTTTTTPPPSCCTAEQARYIEQKEAEKRHQAFVDDVRARFASHPLRRIAGCESSYVHRPEGEPVWDRYNQQGSSASGGVQMLDSTYRSWVATYWPEYAGQWQRAAHAGHPIRYPGWCG